MSSLTVYLADLKGVKWPAPLRRRLQEHFDAVIKAQSKIDSASVVYSSRPPKLGDNDLLIYFVDSASDSVIKKLGGTPNSSATGWTNWNHSATASEVYIDGNQDDPEGVANLAFHELMHNKTRHDNKALHTMKGLSMGRGYITADTPLSKGDIAFMVKYLTTKRAQWTDGYSYYHDPMR